ncbi:MAG: 30S ribosomal protein S20 [Patescibacteria group bacterium]
MPKIKSAKKALRQSEKRRVKNLKRKREIKVAVKGLSKALIGKDKESAEKYLKLAYKKIDKAAKTFVHKNKASRMKSRLAKKVNKILK